MASKKKGRPPRRSKASRRLAKYQHKLKVLRSYVSGFDGKANDSLYEKQPRTAAGKLAKRKALVRFNARYRQLQPFVDRAVKRVVPTGKKSAQKIDVLREYAGLPKIKGLRAVPMEIASKSARVTIRKDGGVSVRQGKVTETLYRLPRRPRGRWEKPSKKDKSKRFLTVGEDALQLIKAMVPKLPEDGLYMIVTREFSLIPTATDRDSLVQTLSDMIYSSRPGGSGDPHLMARIIGVRRVKTDLRGGFNYLEQLRAARTKAQRARVEAKRAQHERAAFKLGKKMKAKK